MACVGVRLDITVIQYKQGLKSTWISHSFAYSSCETAQIIAYNYEYKWMPIGGLVYMYVRYIFTLNLVFSVLCHCWNRANRQANERTLYTILQVPGWKTDETISGPAKLTSPMLYIGGYTHSYTHRPIYVHTHAHIYPFTISIYKKTLCMVPHLTWFAQINLVNLYTLIYF